MPYTPNVPQPNDQLNVSQPQFLTNFQQIFDLWEVEHVPLSTAIIPEINQGKHLSTTLVNNVPFINAVPNVNGHEIILGNTTNAASNRNELLLKRNGSSYYIFTSKISDFNSNQNVLTQVRHFSGIMWRYALVTFNQGGQQMVRLLTDQGYIPFVAVYNVIVSNADIGNANNSDVNVRLMNFTTTTITLWIGSRTTTNTQINNVSVSILVIGQ